MQSRAAVGRHPLHPALVTLPIGAFFLALVGDIAHLSTSDPFWYHLSVVAITTGLIAAVPAAIAGLIDFLGVEMGEAATRKATLHLVLNVCALVAYAGSLALRWHDGALATGRFPVAMALAVAAFVTLGSSGWIGGQMVFEHRVGVAEGPAPRAVQPQPDLRRRVS
jgi:uncharacterized membrane protein